jgi:two-component system sensor histidine kinase DegS
MLLKEIAIDYEEQLYSVKIQLKTKLNQLQEKEQELSERDRTKTYNRDLFSPINNTTDNTAEIIISIEQLKRQMDDLTKKQQSLTDIISGLKTAIQSNDLLNESVHNQNEKEKILRFNDNGLSLLEAQEIERQRIARDLHDTTVQNLTSMVHKAELCIKLIDIDTVRAKLELNTMSNTIKTVINDMRGIIYNLKPMTLDDLGLTITVKRYAN